MSLSLPTGMPTRGVVALCIALSAFSSALVRSRTHKKPAWHPLADSQAHAFYNAQMTTEATERTKAMGKFRGSLWSQDDEFHAKEGRAIRSYAKSHKLQLSATLDALDRGMREHWQTPSGESPDQRVIPCRPRLNY
jgi:hypothetical protein